MIERVIPDRMAFAFDSINELYVILRFGRDDKECRGDIVSFKQFENLRCALGIGSVVESEKERIVVCMNLAQTGIAGGFPERETTHFFTQEIRDE